MAEPTPGRPRMPDSYGIGDRLRQDSTGWDSLVARLASARNYWVATTRPDGRPHSVPVWGIWMDGTFWFATGRTSRKGMNLANNPAIVVHLESGDDVVIIEGVAEEVTDSSILDRFADAYDAKYQFRPEPGSPDQVVYRLRPEVAHSWREKDFPDSATRWQFGED